MPGPWVNTPRATTPLCSLAEARYFWCVRQYATEREVALLLRKGSSATRVSTKRPGV